MSRNGFSPAHSRKSGPPRWASHLRQFSRNSAESGPSDASLSGDPIPSTGSPQPTHPSAHPHPPHLLHHQHHLHSNPHHHHLPTSSTPPRARSPDTMSSNSTIREASFAKAPLPVFERTCTVTVNESFARDEVLMNLDHFDDGVQPGQLMAIDVLPDQRPGFGGAGNNSSANNSNNSTVRRPTPGTGRKDDPSSGAAGASGTGSGNGQDGTGSGPAAGQTADSDLDAGRRYLFIVKDMPKELKARHPTVEIYVAKRVADAFGMKKGSTVLLTPVDASNPAIEASHVELVFKDQYLSRADMWRLAVSELAERTIYRGQMVLFMSTIKAQVTHVFVEGKRVQSAFFGKNTRPIFRSESARFVLFIQMAREMWDFDSDCSGEILFSKVVNGLLPTLFKKWAARKVKHLVTIVLFARVEYDTGLAVDLSEASVQHDYYTGVQSSGNRRPYKDFYRVVVSEMSSGEWTRILYQLKREFNLFRRDISLHHLAHLRPDTAGSLPGASVSDDATGGGDAAGDGSKKQPFNQKYQQHIQAESSSAMYGNVLEAVNMASTLFAHDYVDRDLMRTGISVVVITPGSGVFEVEYDALRRTTEALIGNGIGIDLICIPKVPLHYAPLFRFRHPHYLDRDFTKSRTYSSNSQANSQGNSQGNSHGHSQSHTKGVGAHLAHLSSTPKQSTPLYGSYSSVGAHSLSPSKVGGVGSADAHQQRTFEAMGADRFNDHWFYALPQWLHVSYWASEPNELLMRQGVPLPPLTLEGTRPGKHLEEFAVRCRMYDLQMRGVLETNEIETTPLHADSLFPRSAFKASSDSLAASPVEQGGVLVVQNKLAANVLFDQVYGFQKFAADKLAKQNNKSLWRQLQEYDGTRQKLPSRRRNQQTGNSSSHKREIDDGSAPLSSSALALSGPSTLRKSHFLGGSGAGDTGSSSTHADRRPSTASFMSTTGGTSSHTTASASTLRPVSSSTAATPASSALLSSRGLDYRNMRDNTRSVSFDKESIKSMKSTRSSSSKMPKVMRQISLGQRGFGIAAPKAAIAEVSAETVAASRLPSAPSVQLSMATATSSTSSAAAHGTLPSTPKVSAVFSTGGDGMNSPLSGPTDRTATRPGLGRMIGGSSTDLRTRGLLAPETPTRPIVIRSSDSSTQLAAGSFLGAGLAGRAEPPRPHEDRDLRYSNALRADDAQRVYNSKLLAEAVPEVTKALSPTAAMAPWLMMINPSKPEANKIDSATFNSRWQHVFPRPGEIRVMRWKTLCSPASVPLTTEYFPSKAQFESEYQQQPYSVSQEADEDLLLEVPQTRDNLLRELISLRLSQGFQVVIGPVVAKAFGQKQMKIADIFSTNSQPFEDGTSIFMSIGNTIHQLSFANNSEVQVNIYQRKTDEFNGGSANSGASIGADGATGAGVGAANPTPLYRPAIRTLLDRDYRTSAIDISAPRTERNWNYIDSYLAGHDEQLTENLRFWRARFVLIPMVLPHRAGSVASTNTAGGPGTANSNAGAGSGANPNPNSVDNDEEVRIEGIRKLGQLWQKHRVIPASERHFLQTLSNRHRRTRDTNQNPLDVVYKTEDPSLVIAAELESTLPLLAGGAGGQPQQPFSRKGQLVTNRDPFRKSSLNLAALAEAMQQPVEQGGVRMQNRRWHLRLHYNCFIGSDMTSWLLDNVEDLESRQEAEALGNMLMVSDRDRDRDRDYLYKDSSNDVSEKDAADKKDRENSNVSAASGGSNATADSTNSGTTTSTGAGGSGTNTTSGATPAPAPRELKHQGIFVHVEKRHAFRDGQYFYQISSEYAKPHNTGGWFNTRKASVAAVPTAADLQSSGISLGDGSRQPASRPGSVHEDSDSSRVPPSGASTPIIAAISGAGNNAGAGNEAGSNANNNANKKRPRVVLSKMMKYDVDHRKRSYRPERIDLHYDRLHNPDNCYHIRIEWMNVTAKLIEDAVEVWAREAFQHGLRLVEVPIAEASSISEGNPFRRPYKVRLALAPPTQRPATYYDPNTLAPQAQPGRHFYQRAILRKFGFVLDTEAASNFPPSVDVQYSWGRPSFKYSQYIHRSGIILAQIDDEGDFLLLVNRLYSNRSIASSVRDMRPSDHQQQQQQAQQQQQMQGGGPCEPTPLQSPMVKTALYHSPRLRPAGLEALSQKGSSATMSGLLNKNSGSGPSPIVTSSSVGVPPVLLGSGNTLGMIPSAASAVLFSISTAGLPPGDDPESVMDELEAFSQDPVALEAFYAEVLEKRNTTASAAAAATPATTSGTSSVGLYGTLNTPHLSGSHPHMFPPPSGSTSSTSGTPTSTGRPVSHAMHSSPSLLSSAAARATAEVPDTNIPTLGLPPGLLNSSTRVTSGRSGSSLLSSGGGGDSSPLAPPSSGSNSLRSPASTSGTAGTGSQFIQPTPLTPIRTTSPGFLASRLFLRRSSVDDIGLQRQSAEGNNDGTGRAAQGSPSLPSQQG
ncbi:vacuolar membrane-associated protein iml1 [Sporothrix stenoceras]|uniref:Vacuolar membrane-associated protein IML1 n=1 Tax=Sporothrix stenoceras TaxID=5173 RepID=A0ABR3ZT08_9PEZI